MTDILAASPVEIELPQIFRDRDFLEALGGLIRHSSQHTIEDGGQRLQPCCKMNSWPFSDGTL